MASMRWKEYMEHLLNVNNVLDGIIESEIGESPKDSFTEMDVKRAIG